MKYKKYSYILVLILMLLVGTKEAYAADIWGNETQTKTCYYMSDDGNFKTRVNINWHLIKDWWEGPAVFYTRFLAVQSYTNVMVDKVGENNYPKDAEFVVNWIANITLSNTIKGGTVTFDDIYTTVWDANGNFRNYEEPACPKYVVFQDSTFYWVWVTDNQTQAQKAQDDIRAQGIPGYYGSLTTADKYWKTEVESGKIIINQETGEPTCDDYVEIFGEKDDPESIRYLVNQVLQYVRIIVPILVILLGTIDFAKAVMAGKEDNMRKAQSDFAKRVIMGVAVFFVPLLVDVIMDLADMVWNGSYTHCGL